VLLAPPAQLVSAGEIPATNDSKMERSAEAVPYDCADESARQKAKGAVICVEGKIGQKTAQQIQDYKGRIARIVINSEGGNADSAMAVGRRLFSDQSILEISEKCISACANYLVPAATSIEIRPNAFIAMHGSAPRGIVEYSQNITRDRGNTRDAFKQVIQDFPRIRQKYTDPEIRYFDDIFRDDAYITRYREQVRNILVEKSLKCKQYAEFLLILDREYLDAFGIRSTGWKLGSPIGIISSVGMRYPNSNIIYGFRGDATKLLTRPGSNCQSPSASDMGIF